MNPITNLDDALHAIKSFDGAPETFRLPIADELNDATGMTMAIITDAALARDWEPNGLEQHDGYRVLLYREMQ